MELNARHLGIYASIARGLWRRWDSCTIRCTIRRKRKQPPMDCHARHTARVDRDHTNLTLHTAAQPGYTAAGAKKSNPQAYADDLNTMTAGPNAQFMQHLQATWLSAFCAFTGMEMHPDKIHATTLGSTLLSPQSNTWEYTSTSETTPSLPTRPS